MFYNKKLNKAWYIINIDGQDIAEVTSSNFLGVIIDNRLNWRDHESFVCRKVARGLGVIIKARKVLQKGSLISLYYSFIYPYLIYCNQIWGSACKTQIEPLFILQKKALRIITGVHPRSPSEPLFRQLKFLNCENIFKYLVGRLMYRVYHGELSTLQFLFVKNSDTHMHDTRQSGHYHIPVCRTNLGKSSLRSFGSWLWNKILSADISPNVSDFFFSRNLKTAIYNNLLQKKFHKAVCCILYPLYTGAATFLPPLCDHKSGQVAVERRKEAERLPWSLNGGTQDVQTSPWTPWSPWSFEHVQNSRTKVAEEVGRSQVVRRRQEEGTHIAMVAEWMHSGRPWVAP